MPSKEPYPSSFTDKEWALIRPLLPGPHKLGRPPRYTQRSVVEAILYIVRSGCGWRMMPHDLPPWRLCYYYFMTWRKAGLWQKIHDSLRDAVRLKSGKKKLRPLRSSTARALKYLTTEECAATMQAKRSWDENDISWLIRWV
jgi:transposase